MDAIQLFNNSPLSYRWSWMKRLADKGYFGIDSEKKKTVVEDMMTSLNAIYKDRWCFQFYNKNSSPHIIIHFPKFTITNSAREKHEITDLYVRLKFFLTDKGPQFGTSISGFRTTLTDKEAEWGYLHSHISSKTNYFDSFNGNCEDTLCKSFCLGTSEVLDLMQTMEGAEDFDKNIFELFLLTLDTYVKWESLEGGPYIKMQYLSNVQSSTQRYNYQRDYAQLAFNIIKQDKNLQKSWEYTYNNGNIKVVDSLTFEKSLKKLFVDRSFFYLLSVKTNGDYYKVSENLLASSSKYDKYILFRGEKRYLKIKNTTFKGEARDNNLEVLQIHPMLLKAIVTGVNNIITEKYINYYAKRKRIEQAKRAISLYNLQRRDNSEDTIPVLNTELC